MATIINTPGSGTSDNSGGWAAVLVIVLAILVLGFFFLRGRPVTPATPNTGGTVQVNIPSGNATGAGYTPSSSGGSSGTGQSGSSGGGASASGSATVNP